MAARLSFFLPGPSTTFSIRLASGHWRPRWHFFWHFATNLNPWWALDCTRLDPELSPTSGGLCWIYESALQRKWTSCFTTFLQYAWMKKTRHCPSKEVHPWKTPMSPCRMLMSSKCKVKPLNRSLLSGGRISMIMINWSYLLSSLSIVFLFRGACRQNGGVGEQTFAIFDSSLQSWGCLQNWHSDQQFDLFCIFYILLRLIRWDHNQILVHIYHRGHVVSQLLARHLWDW